MCFFFQAEDGIRDLTVTGVQTCALPISGISFERIPRIEEMNDILGKIGWGAVAVDGFIPPAAFMEFQAYKVLVIACDMRQIHHIEYTPAPDIVHEAAGHAPIIVDRDRKSTRLNSSHSQISYAVFCLKKTA